MVTSTNTLAKDMIAPQQINSNGFCYTANKQTQGKVKGRKWESGLFGDYITIGLSLRI